MTNVDTIIAFENGDLSERETLDLFAGLIKTGTAWTLQGSYGRMANGFLEQGLIDPDGTVTELARDMFDWLEGDPDPHTDWGFSESTLRAAMTGGE